MMNQEIKIKNVLKDLGITPNIKGYHYLAEAISIRAKANEENDFNKPQMELYREVAEKFKTTSSRTERAIRHAIGQSISRNNTMYIKFFGNERVTCSHFIARMAEYITLPESEEVG